MFKDNIIYSMDTINARTLWYSGSMYKRMCIISTTYIYE